MGPGELGRLAVGALLLALAIFLSLNLGKSGATAGNQPAGNDPLTGSAAESSHQPAWQAPVRDELTAPTPEMARPSFSNPGTSSSQAAPLFMTAGQESQWPLSVPQIGSQYEPNSSHGQSRSSLVPVEPRPGFGLSMQFAGTVHVVRKGDTLQSIAGEYYGSAGRYLDIYLANQHLLSNPGQLPEGLELRIPE